MMSPTANFILTLFLGPFGVHRFVRGEIGMGILYLCTGGLFGIGWIIDCVKAATGLQSNTAFQHVPITELPTVSPDGLILKSDEICHYQGQAASTRTKNVVTGYESGNVGVSVRVAKGLSVRTGGSKGAPIRSDVVNQVPGMLYITSQRIVFLCSRDAFDKPYSVLTAVNITGNTLLLQFGNTSYDITVSAPERIRQILTLAINQYSNA